MSEFFFCIYDDISKFEGTTQRSVWSSAPSLVFSAASLVAAAVTLGLPETRGVALPDTVAHVESHAFTRRR